MYKLFLFCIVFFKKNYTKWSVNKITSNLLLQNSEGNGWEDEIIISNP